MTANTLPAPGERVHIAQQGMHYFNGTTLCHVTDRWGTHALVLLDCGAVKRCNGLTKRGLGWYKGANPYAHGPDFSPAMLSD